MKQPGWQARAPLLAADGRFAHTVGCMSNPDSALQAGSNPWGDLLARSQPPRHRLDVILSDPAAASLVPRLPVEDFYYLVKDLGIDDAGELLALASADQLRGCIDFDVWERDRVVSSRLLRWLRVLADELLPGRFARAIQAVDIEVLALLLARSCHVHDRSVGEEPAEDSTLPRYNTPDTFYCLEFEADNETTQVIEQVIDRLYGTSAEFARRLLLETKWGLASELEESSYRLRSGRMADLGFIEYYEALEAYRYVNPQSAAAVEHTTWRPLGPTEEVTVLPAVFAWSFGEDSFLTRALRRLVDARLVEHLGATLLALFNRVLAADHVDPADIDAVRDTLSRAHDTLSLGLEQVSGGDLERATVALERAPLLFVFRVGFSLTVDLARVAKRRRDAGDLDPNLDPLLETRPLYPRGLDDPPGGGTRPFRTLADVARADRFLNAAGSN